MHSMLCSIVLTIPHGLVPSSIRIVITNKPSWWCLGIVRPDWFNSRCTIWTHVRAGISFGSDRYHSGFSSNRININVNQGRDIISPGKGIEGGIIIGDSYSPTSTHRGPAKNWTPFLLQKRFFSATISMFKHL
jgi:hypothetical protein